MPTEAHQLMVKFLFLAFHSVVAPARLGTLVFAPIRIQTGANRFREPDLAFSLAENAERRTSAYWRGADLVVEVVSEDESSRYRDWRSKPVEYAAAGIREYWIIDPEQRVIRVLGLDQGSYSSVREFFDGEFATSELLDGLSIRVDDVWKAAAGD